MLSLGEALTQGPLTPSFVFGRPMFVLTGQHNVVFCGNGSRVLGVPDCREGERGQLEAVRGLLPNVLEGMWGTWRVGHCNQLHAGAGEGFKRVHDWLAG